MKKRITLILTVVFLLTIGTVALASSTITLNVAPGENPRTAGYTFSNGAASFTCKCYLAGSNDTIRVFLDVYETRNGKTDWYERASHNFTSNGSYTLKYNTTNKARLRTYGYKENAGSGTVVVTVNN